jgi:CRP-like cAMP-binding protein
VQNVTARFKEGVRLSTVEKIILLKKVSFFEGMTIDQLKILADVSEEDLFAEGKSIYQEGDPGGILYVVVQGKVGIEVEGARKGSTARIATAGAYSYFGEMRLFDNSPRSEKAVAVLDTLTLHLRREPLVALTRQYPDLALKLINVLSQRLREVNDRIMQLTVVKPRELHKLYDQLS